MALERAHVLRGPVRHVFHAPSGQPRGVGRGDATAQYSVRQHQHTTILVLSSVTCQLGVFAAERGDVKGLRRWFIITFLMGSVFIGGQVWEYAELVHEGLTLSSNAYGSAFYLTTGFHGLHVTGGLIAFLFVLATTYVAKRFTHDQATRAIVTSYYWHFVDVVWIALFFMIYVLQ